jgi:serine/threonine protein kinase
MAGGPLSAQVSQKIIESILDAVEVIHNASMLHRDIKPDNLIIGNDGRVVLIDFGSARAYSDEKTVAQTAMVSPGYAPLEQYNPNARKGAYTDIYSIGATFYYMLTGQKPLNVTERYTERMKAPHEINKNVSMQVSSAVMLAMEMKPEDRFQNIQDFRIALSMLSAPNPILEKPKTSDVQQPPKPKAVNKKSSGSSVLGGCLIAFLIFSLLGIIVTFVIIFALSAALDGSGSTQQDSSYEQETSISEPDQEKITNTSQEEPSYEKPDETNRPKIYHGVLAGNEITVKLNGFEDFIEGSYVYDVVGQSIKLEESYRNDEEIEIKEYTNGNYTGRFNFSFFNRNDDELDGTWTSTDGSSSYRVILYQR